MEKEAVANSSSLIFLAKLDIFNLAKNILSKILVPTSVIKEVFEKDFPENNIIKKELDSFLIKLEVKEIKYFPLDEGEKAAISLCLEKNVKLFLSDDKKARIYARTLGIEVVGVIGILLYNLENNKINKKEFMELLNKLIGKGYYISPGLYAEIIKIVGNK